MNPNEYTASEARTHLTDILSAAQHANRPTRITRHGRPVAYVVPADEYEWLIQLGVDATALDDAADTLAGAR